MENKINIFDIELNVLTAKEAMKQILKYMESGTVSAVELVTLEMLMRGQDNPAWKKQMEQMELLLPGEREIFEAVDIKDKNVIKDLDNKIFFKMFLKYLQRNKKTVFLLSEQEDDLYLIQNALRLNERGIRLAGQALLPEGSSLKEDIINEINGVEPDCIFSSLSFPWQEEFISESKPLLNARLWMGCGPMLYQNMFQKKNKGKIRHFFLKKVFRYQVERQKSGIFVKEEQDL